MIFIYYFGYPCLSQCVVIPPSTLWKVEACLYVWCPVVLVKLYTISWKYCMFLRANKLCLPICDMYATSPSPWRPECSFCFRDWFFSREVTAWWILFCVPRYNNEICSLRLHKRFYTVYRDYWYYYIEYLYVTNFSAVTEPTNWGLNTLNQNKRDSFMKSLTTH